MKKHVRPSRKRTLDKEKLRPVTPNALARVRGGGNVQAYPGTEYDAIPIPQFDDY